jgi:hypothetical protein
MSPLSKARTCLRIPKRVPIETGGVHLIGGRRPMLGVRCFLLTLLEGPGPNLSILVRGRGYEELRQFRRENVRR